MTLQYAIKMAADNAAKFGGLRYIHQSQRGEHICEHQRCSGSFLAISSDGTDTRITRLQQRKTFGVVAMDDTAIREALSTIGIHDSIREDDMSASYAHIFIIKWLAGEIY